MNVDYRIDNIHLNKISSEYQIHITTNSKTYHVLRNKHNYSQSIFMFIIRGVIICIKDLNI